ncbi:hypothetical protein ACX1C1_03040 [Paenibacillus sp. strain BS8-2]
MRVSLKSFVAGFVCCALLSATTAYAAVGSSRIDYGSATIQGSLPWMI